MSDAPPEPDNQSEPEPATDVEPSPHADVDAPTQPVDGEVAAPQADAPTTQGEAPATEAEESESDVDALQAELAELRIRNAQLESSADHLSVGDRFKRAGRSTAVVLLIVLGVLCFTVSPVAIWGRNLVLNTDKYVETLKPIGQNPGVQAAVIKAVDKQVETHVDVPALVGQVLPPKAATLVGPLLQNALSGLVNTVVTKFVQSEAFVTLWVQINREAHQEIVYLLTGKHNGAVDIDSSGRVILNLAPIVSDVKQQLVAAGLSVASNIPAVGATIQIAQVEGLAKAQQYTRLLNTVADWLPWLGLVLIAGAVATARRRRRALIASMLGVGGGMILIAIGLIIGRNYYLNGVPPSILPRSTAEDVFNTIVRFLRDGIRLVLAVALLIAFFAWLLGPGRGAVKTRRWAMIVPKAALSGAGSGAVGQFVRAYTTPIRIGIVALALIVLVLWDGPSLAVIITLAVLVIVALIVVEALRTARTGTGPPAQSATAGT